jgi:hypothetical protein
MTYGRVVIRDTRWPDYIKRAESYSISDNLNLGRTLAVGSWATRLPAE